MDVRKPITYYKKNQKKAYALLISLTLLLSMSHVNISSSDQKFKPVNRGDLHKIISMNHPHSKLVKAIIEVESRWNIRAVSTAGAIGLMQVLPSSGRLHAGYSREELFCPEKNIIAGCRILKYYQRTSPDLRTALHKYSGGAEGYYEKVARRL